MPGLLPQLPGFWLPFTLFKVCSKQAEHAPAPPQPPPHCSLVLDAFSQQPDNDAFLRLMPAFRCALPRGGVAVACGWTLHCSCPKRAFT